MTDRSELVQALDALLEPARFKDYGPNGLQVEGRREVRHLVSGVTASRALIEAAIASGADTLLVHHGLFWRGQDGRVTGWMRQRLGLLLTHDINLLAYHLPLDAHPELGNNARASWAWWPKRDSASRSWVSWAAAPTAACTPMLLRWGAASKRRSGVR
jgi:putative NIF3 family GTP cyclohydrolase 1 type 2